MVDGASGGTDCRLVRARRRSLRIAHVVSACIGWGVRLPALLQNIARPPRSTGVEPFDTRYRGFYPGEVVVLAHDDRETARLLACDVAAGVAAYQMPVGHNQVFWGHLESRWAPAAYDVELRARAPEHHPWIVVEDLTGIHVRELVKKTESWARGARCPGLVIVEELEDLRGAHHEVARLMKTMALREPQLAVLLLSFCPKAEGPTVADYDEVGEAVDFLVWLQAPTRRQLGQLSLLGHTDLARVEVRKARSAATCSTFAMDPPVSRLPRRAP